MHAATFFVRTHAGYGCNESLLEAARNREPQLTNTSVQIVPTQQPDLRDSGESSGLPQNEQEAKKETANLFTQKFMISQHKDKLMREFSQRTGHTNKF